MGKTFKRAISVFMAIAMLLAVSVTALAVEGDASEVAIQVNGAIIDYPGGVAPYYDDEIGRVFVPFSDLLTALGAEVSFDDETGTATAVRGDVTVAYVLGADDYSITTGETTRVITPEVAPIELNDHVLVPVRFITESLGARVGWDETELTVLIVDPYLISEANTATYEILDKVFGIAEPSDKNAETHADLAVDLTVTESGATVSLPATATIDAVSSATALDAKTNVKADLAGLLGDAVPGVSAELDVDADLIVNLETGVLGLQSDGLFALAEQFLGLNLGIEPGAWVSLDTAALLAELAVEVPAADAADVPVITDTKGIFDYLTATLVQALPLESVDDYAALAGGLETINGIYADESFKKTDDGYVSTVSISESGDAVTISLTILTDADDAATGIALDIELSGAELGSLKFHVDTDGDAVALSISLTSEGVDVSLTLDVTTQETDAEPRSAIPADATVVALDGLLAGIA